MKETQKRRKKYHDQGIHIIVSITLCRFTLKNRTSSDGLGND